MIQKILIILSFFAISFNFLAQCTGFAIDASATDESAGSLGSITICALNGSPDYEFVIENGQGTTISFSGSSPCHTFFGRPAGTYTATVSDVNNCVSSQQVVIEAYVPSGTLDCASATALSCGVAVGGNNANGVNNVESYGCNDWTETGREEVYTYTPSQNGPFSVKLSGYSGADLDVYILSSCDPSSCIGAVFSDSAYFNNGVAGTTYYIVVDSDDGNSSTYNIEVDCTVPSDPCLGLSLTVLTTDETIATGNGTAEAQLTGISTDSASFLWSNGGAGALISGLNAGTYSVTATTQTGCELQASGVVEFDTSGASGCDLTLSFVKTHETDTGANDGTVLVNVFNGTAPYTYNWSHSNLDTNAFSGLAPGDYAVTVVDASGCGVNDTVSILSAEDECALVVLINGLDATENSVTDGAATVLVSGGTPPYTYQWNTGATTAEIYDLQPDVYFVNIEDANGCSDVQFVSIATVSVDFKFLNEVFNVFPNPVSQYVTFRLDDLNNQWFDLEITDIKGAVVYSNRLASQSLNQGFEFDASHLQSGTYFVRLMTASNQVAVKAFLKK